MEGQLESYKSFKSISKLAHFRLYFTISRGTSQAIKAVNLKGEVQQFKLIYLVTGNVKVICDQLNFLSENARSLICILLKINQKYTSKFQSRRIFAWILPLLKEHPKVQSCRSEMKGAAIETITV